MVKSSEFFREDDMSRCFLKFQLNLKGTYRFSAPWFWRKPTLSKGCRFDLICLLLSFWQKNSRIIFFKRHEKTKTNQTFQFSKTSHQRQTTTTLPLGKPPQSFRESLGLPERFTTSRALGTSLSTRSACCTRSFSSLVFISFTWRFFGLMLGWLFFISFLYFLFGGRRKKNYPWVIAGTWLFWGAFELDSHRDFGRTLFLMDLRYQYLFKSASLPSVW